MNNLDPEVAEKPDELVVYGGIGKAARNWECFDAIVEALQRARRRRDAAGPVGQAGRRVPHARRRAARADRQLEPRAALGDLGALPRARPQGPDDVRPDDGRLLDLHRHAGHRAGHLRDLRRGGAASTSAATLAGRWILTGGPRRHGRRAAARRDDGRRVARSPSSASRAASTCACARATSTSRRPTSTKRSRSSRTRRARQASVGRAARQRGRDRCPSWCARGDHARPRHRPDLGARPAQRLPARRLDASSNGARRAKTRSGSDVVARREAVDGASTSQAMLDFQKHGRPDLRLRQQHPPGGVRRGRRRTRSTSPASCRPTSGRCSARARARSAGSRCPAIPRTSTRPTRR